MKAHQKSTIFRARPAEMVNFAVQKNAPVGAKNLHSRLSNGLTDSLEGPKFSRALELGGGGHGPPVPPLWLRPCSIDLYWAVVSCMGIPILSDVHVRAATRRPHLSRPFIIVFFFMFAFTLAERTFVYLVRRARDYLNC